MEKEEIVNMSLYIGEWSRCLTAQYQRDQLYRFGKFDDCGRQWNDLKTAFSAKFSKDDEEARKIIEGTHYVNRTSISPTLGVIWDLKEKPGWD